MYSILTSIKKLLGVGEDYTHFDPDIIIGINTSLSILSQLGVGPQSGFSISDNSAVWSDFIPENSQFESVKTFIHLKTKLLFDPPSSSFVIESMNKILGELEWRLTVAAESIPEETEEKSK